VFFALKRLPAQAQIDGLEDSHGAANPWQITGSMGLTIKDVQPPPL
jgi:exo-poly-alpha-galacturonosidase